MEFFYSPLFWLTTAGTFILGWLVKSFLASQEKTKLETSIIDRDNRLMAISRDQHKLITGKDKQILTLQSKTKDLTIENKHFLEHNTDLRKTILELKSTIQSDDEIITEVFSIANDVIVEAPENNEPLSEVPTQAYGLLSQTSDTPTNKVETIIPDYQKKWKKTRKKHKNLVVENAKLKSKLASLNKLLKKRPKPKTIVKVIPVIITEEYLIKEQIDKKKLEKMLSSNLPISKTKKLVNTTRKKGKAKIVKK